MMHATLSATAASRSRFVAIFHTALAIRTTAAVLVARRHLIFIALHARLAVFSHAALGFFAGAARHGFTIFRRHVMVRATGLRILAAGHFLAARTFRFRRALRNWLGTIWSGGLGPGKNRQGQHQNERLERVHDRISV